MDISARESSKKNIEIFCCYSHKDQEMLLDLKKHLISLQRENLISLRADIDIDPGVEWEKVLQRDLNTAQIILLLISPDFMASDYCYSIEMQRAIERHDQGEACVIPIILRPVSWQKTLLGRLQALPTNANPIVSSKWHYQDEAFCDVVEGVRNAVIALQDKSSDVSFITSSSRLTHVAIPKQDSTIYVPRLPLIQRNFRRSPVAIGVLMMLTFLLLSGASIGIYDTATNYWSMHISDQQYAQVIAQTRIASTASAQSLATSIASQTIYTQTTSRSPSIIDPLNKEQGSYWESRTNGSCSFNGGAYRVKDGQYNTFNTCRGYTDNLSNFAFQVTMKFAKGDQADGGGILFRAETNQSGNIDVHHSYFFYISRQRKYVLSVFTGPETGRKLAVGISKIINTESNLLTIIASGKFIFVYINKQLIVSVTDSSLNSGQLCLYAFDTYNPVDLAFNNAQIWIL